MKRLGLITFLITICVILGTLSLYFFHAGFLDSIEARSYDFRFRVTRGPIPHSPEIAIVAIDEKSIAELGRYPWSREVYVPFLDNLKAAGTKALLMDAFFPEEQSPKIDRAFARAIKRAGMVTLACAVDLAQSPQVPDLTISLPRLTQAAKATAHINFLPDEDGVNRSSLLIATYFDEKTEEEQVFPSLGLMGAMEALGLGFDDIAPGETFISLGDIDIPVTYSMMPSGALLPMMLVNYPGGPGTYETFSFADIKAGRIAPERLKDKILFFGATALGIYDMRESPYSPNTPGVEVHAAIADNIIRGDFLHKGGLETIADMALIILLSLTVYLITMRNKPIVALPAVTCIIGGFFIFASSAFSHGYWISMVYPILSMLLTYSLTAYLRFYLSDRKAREMRNIFSSYVSRKVVDELVKHPDAAKIGGDKKDITILFSDVKGYTSYSEKRSPEEVVKTLNEYLGAMSSVVIDSDGTLDKFLGDGIMAYWGAPLSQPNHHELAVRCALDMIKRLAELHKKWAAEGTEPFSIRVGLNSGRVISGNIGATGKKMEYTVIGDNVNLASRLESTAKAYGLTILASQYTYEETKDLFLFREIDYIRVVGKTEPIRIYEVLQALDEPVDEAVTKRIKQFVEALKVYRSRNFTDARAMFASLYEKNPEDLASKVYIQRCESFISEPPAEDWDGVYVRTSK